MGILIIVFDKFDVGLFSVCLPTLNRKYFSTSSSPAISRLKTVPYGVSNFSSRIKRSAVSKSIMIQSCMPRILCSSVEPNRFLFSLDTPARFPFATIQINDITSIRLQRFDHCTQHVCVSIFGSLESASRIIFFLFCKSHQRFEHRRSYSCYQWGHQRSSWRWWWWLWQWWRCTSTQTAHCR